MNSYSKKFGFGIIRLSESNLNVHIRNSFLKSLEYASKDNIKGLVLIGQSSNFTNGTDHLEVILGKSNIHQPNNLMKITNIVENFAVPVIGCLQGNLFGGAFEIALACHWRITHSNTHFSFSDLNHGLITGAGSSQRLCRLIGQKQALHLLTSARIINAVEAMQMNIVDFNVGIVNSDDMLDAALTFASSDLVANTPITMRMQSKRKVFDDISDIDKSNISVSTQSLKKMTTFAAPIYAAKLVDAASTSSFEQGIEQESALFMELINHRQTKALQYLMFGEKRLAKEMGDDKNSDTSNDDNYFTNCTAANALVPPDKHKICSTIWRTLSPFLVSKEDESDHPNRNPAYSCTFLRSFFRECQALLDEGASASQIDSVLRNNIGCSHGPFELMDLLTASENTNSNKNNNNDLEHSARKFLELFLERSPEQSSEESLSREGVGGSGGIACVSDEEILERCMLTLVNECFKLLEEGRGDIAPEMLDIIFVYMLGFPKHLGGVLWWAEREMGLRNVATAMLKYVDRYPLRFEACSLLKDVVASGASLKEEMFFRKTTNNTNSNKQI